MWIDYKEVKSRSPILAVLLRYNVVLRKVNHSAMRGDCPLPQHHGSKGSFSVSVEKNVWSCNSKGCIEARGKKGGNVLDFVSVMERCSIREAAVKLSEWFSTPAPTEIPAPVVPVNAPLGFELKDVQFSHPYLLARGFEEEECEYLGVGFFPGKGSMHGRVVFPIHNEKGELVAYAGRSVEDVDVRWKLPAGFEKSRVVYNLHRVEGDTVFLVESFWGVLACVRAGVMNCVAVMGSHVSEAQAKLLSRFSKVVIVFDGDEAGREGTVQAMEELRKRNISVESVVLPANRQPDAFSADGLRKLLGLDEDFGPYSVLDVA